MNPDGRAAVRNGAGPGAAPSPSSEKLAADSSRRPIGWGASLFWLVLGGLSLLGAALGGRYWLSPYRALPEGGLRLFVGGCQFSQSAFASVQSQAGVAARLVPLPIRAAGPRISREVCGVALATVHRHSRWRRWLPSRWACAWLEADAEAFYRAHFVHLPAFSVGETPVAFGQERPVLNEHGLSVATRDGRVQIGLLGQETPAAAPTPGSVPGAQPPTGDPATPALVNQPIGW